MLESRALRGAVAQLGERRVRNAKVEGSIPFRSTNPLFLDDPKWSPAPFTNSGKQALLVVPAGQVGPSDLFELLAADARKRSRCEFERVDQ
jgi:hypothetical protein